MRQVTQCISLYMCMSGCCVEGTPAHIQNFKIIKGYINVVSPGITEKEEKSGSQLIVRVGPLAGPLVILRTKSS